MASLNGIEFQLRPGSDSISYSKDGLSATRIFNIKWDDRDAMLLALVGKSSSSGALINRSIGQPFGGTDFPLFCTQAVSRGIGKITITSEGVASYDRAFITAQYSQIRPDEEEVPENNETGDLIRPITTSIDFTTEILSVPGGTFTANSKKIKNSFPVLVPKTNINITFRNIPFSSYASTLNSTDSIEDRIEGKQGRVNSDLPTWIAGRNFVDPETLMFNGASATRETPVFKGELLESPWTVNMSFTHKPRGWNKVYNPADPDNWFAVTPAPFKLVTMKDLQVKYV